MGDGQQQKNTCEAGIGGAGEEKDYRSKTSLTFLARTGGVKGLWRIWTSVSNTPCCPRES